VRGVPGPAACARCGGSTRRAARRVPRRADRRTRTSPRARRRGGRSRLSARVTLAPILAWTQILGGSPRMRRDSLVQIPDALLRGGSRGDARFIMGIDGGATKTLAAVLDLHTKALHFAHGGPSNEDAIGVETAVHALLQVADEALARAGIAQHVLAMAVL